MIEQIEIANFRGFSLPVKVRLRPITVLIGKNSAGKSTLIKFLLMLRQSLEATEGEFLVTEGRHVELGGFGYQQNTNPGYGVRRLRFQLSIRTPEGPSATMQHLFEALNKSQQAHPKGNTNGFQLKVNLDGAGGEATSEETLYDVRAEVLYQRPDVGRHVVTASQRGQEKFEIKAKGLKQVRFLSFPTHTTRPEGELEALVHNSFLRPAREVLLGTRHISPVRVSQRVVALDKPPENDVGHHGEFAIPHLYRLLDRGRERGAFLKHHIHAIANVDKLQFEERARNFLSHFQGRNVETMAMCHLNDFGFGVSQCLPVLVQGALLARGQLLIVEQPEAQLHPTAQLKLGSFFADLWTEFGIPSLLETHSDNLVLRLRKLVARKALGPADVSLAYFSVENRAVRVQNLDILEDGRLQEGLPMEFFGANILEALDLEQ